MAHMPDAYEQMLKMNMEIMRHREPGALLAEHGGVARQCLGGSCCENFSNRRSTGC
jgi:hypothetical protein